MKINANKKDLRIHIKELKKKQSAERLKEWSQSALLALESHPLFICAQTVLCYYSLGDEIDTHDFISRWSKKKNILLPVVHGDILELHLYNNELIKGTFGIYEPTSKATDNYDQIDLAIIPGVAFDLHGARLGRGKGYYDRLLPLIKAYKIGLCFGFQKVENIFTEPHDIPMDEIITEKQYHK
jgi:5-formyltetrahydrofolate cyclo-ligase